MERSSSRILIVGGGIAGLALARALRRQGFVPEIVERGASWPAGGTGLYLPGNGLRALASLGVADEVLARGVHLSHQRILNHAGRQLAEIALAKVWNPVGPCVGIARAELHRILLEGTAGVALRLGTTVTSLSQEAGRVEVAFTDRSSGSYDLVVGADGIHSTVRHLVFGRIPARPVGQVSWRFLVDHSGAIQTWTAMLARRQAFLMVPVAVNRFYCYADLITPATEDPTGRQLARFRTFFAQFAEPVPAILRQLESADRIHFAPIEEVALDTWVRGRVVLVGDAAHATSPNMAEGAAMALEDALVLTAVLGTHSSVDAALSAFNERRRARVGWVRHRTHRRDRIRNLPVLLRDLALRLAGPALYQRDYRPLLEEP